MFSTRPFVTPYLIEVTRQNNTTENKHSSPLLQTPSDPFLPVQSSGVLLSVLVRDLPDELPGPLLPVVILSCSRVIIEVKRDPESL